jgi:hypothetical protein
MPIPETLIVGLGIGQAEFGLVEKQKRRLLGLETTRLQGLAAVIGALAVAVWLGRKNAALPATTGQKEFAAQHCWMCAQRGRRLEGPRASRHGRRERVRGSWWGRWDNDAKLGLKRLGCLVMAFK